MWQFRTEQLIVKFSSGGSVIFVESGECYGISPLSLFEFLSALS